MLKEDQLIGRKSILVSINVENKSTLVNPEEKPLCTRQEGPRVATVTSDVRRQTLRAGTEFRAEIID